MADIIRIAGYNRTTDSALAGFSCTKATDNKNNSANLTIISGDVPLRGQEILIRDEELSAEATLYPITGSTPTDSAAYTGYWGDLIQVLQDVKISQIGLKTAAAGDNVYLWKLSPDDYTLETEIISGVPSYTGGYSMLSVSDDLRLGPGYYALIVKVTAVAVGYYAGYIKDADSYISGDDDYYYRSTSAPAHGASMTAVNPVGYFPIRAKIVYYPLTIDYRYFCGIVDQVEQDPFPNNADRWRLSCRDYTYSLDKKLVQEIYESQRVDEIVLDLMARYAPEFTTANVQTAGPMVERKVFDYVHPSECLTFLAEYVGWSWYIDSSGDLHFYEPDTTAATAPVTITKDNCSRFRYKLDGQEIRNRVYVKGAYYLSDSFRYELVADGLARAWVMPYPPKNLTMQVSGESVSIGEENKVDESTVDYVYNTEEKTVRCLEGVLHPVAGESLTFIFQFDLPVIAMVEDTASQQAIAAAEGGDGIYEFVIVDQNLGSNMEAEKRAEEDLRQYANPKVKGSFATDVRGFEPGQVVRITYTERGLDNYFVVQRVGLARKGKFWEYSIEFGGRIRGLEDVFKAALSAKRDSRDSKTSVLQKFAALDTQSAAVSNSAGVYTTRTPIYFAAGDADAAFGFVCANSTA